MDSINVGLSEIKSASSLCDLGAWFDECMTMNKHVSKVCSKAFGALYKINKIQFLTEETTKTLIHAFVSSHLDYCNSLLYGIPQYQMNRLQRVLNAAARVTCRLPRFAHVTTALFRLHWLPIKYRILYKIALLTSKVLKGMAPSYLSDLLVVQTKSHYWLRRNSYNPGQKSWDKCVLVALYKHVNQRVARHSTYTSPTPTPTPTTMLKTCTRNFFWLSTLYWEGEEGTVT